MTKTSLTIIVNSNQKVYQDKTIIVSLKLLNKRCVILFIILLHYYLQKVLTLHPKNKIRV